MRTLPTLPDGISNSRAALYAYRLALIAALHAAPTAANYLALYAIAGPETQESHREHIASGEDGDRITIGYLIDTGKHEEAFDLLASDTEEYNLLPLNEILGYDLWDGAYSHWGDMNAHLHTGYLAEHLKRMHR